MSYEDHEVANWTLLGIPYRATPAQAAQVQLEMERSTVYLEWSTLNEVLERCCVCDSDFLVDVTRLARRRAELAAALTEVVIAAVTRHTEQP